MGCQKGIPPLIIEKKGHCILVLKSNQSELFEQDFRKKTCLIYENNIFKLLKIKQMHLV